MPDDVFQFERAEDSPGFSLWQVSSLWQRRINAGLRPFNLTHAQFVLLASLMWLADNETPLTQAQLASHAQMDTMMTSNVLRTLEAKGLLTRDAHPTDMRAKSLTITDAGRALAAETVRVVETIDREFFDKLGANVQRFNQDLQALIAENRDAA
ncbi:MAG: MarR family transcriptional regulator [Ardenticatenaceae bacterium]|nr:MarR family transcriptional regulator [Anaerolineales bacterium]MCB8922262.1 MarR family transcriptional regulator [Ardenticatenaceae bacterium]MCB8990553.1 MarR family transcriptional regulator [Ardenticatenaceae bacterium]